MPKLKTNKATRKRFKITANKKVMATQANRRHLLGDKNPSKKRQLRGLRVLNKTDARAVIKSLPYG